MSIELLPVFEKPRPLYMDYMGTSFASGEFSVGMDARLSRCYELAGYAVLIGDLGDGVLVHGSIHGRALGCQRIGHGWVLLNVEPGEPAQVWEPITGEVYDRDEWYAWARAEDEVLYSKEEAAITMMRDGTWGRWHQSEWP